VYGLSASEVLTTIDTVWAAGKMASCQLCSNVQPWYLPFPPHRLSQASLPQSMVVCNISRAGIRRLGGSFWMDTSGTIAHLTPVLMWLVRWQCSGCRCMPLKMGTNFQVLRKFYFHQVWRNAWCMIQAWRKPEALCSSWWSKLTQDLGCCRTRKNSSE